MHRGKLYEHYSKMVAGRVKFYDVKKVLSIGGFRTNRLGKIDRAFEEDAKKHGLKISIACKKSPVGLHAMGTWEEQVAYESLWGNKKSRRGNMKKYDKSPEWQYENCERIIERYNRQNNTPFWKFICSKK